MSTFYLVLYIFLAIIVLLCVISCIMYMLHICNKDKDYDEEQFFSPREAEANLNSTETTQFMDETVNSGEQVQLLNVKKRAEMYEKQNIENEHTGAHNKPPVAPRPVSIQKPLLPVKPNIASQSPRNSIVLKPATQPPPPPQIEVAVVHPNSIQKTYSVKKPKAPPPPPPSVTESFYENTPKRPAPPPPTYHDVMNDIPVDNYLSDND